MGRSLKIAGWAMTRSAIVLGIFFGVVVLLPGVGHSYREDESEQAIDADIDRGENALVGKLAEEEQRLVHGAERALKAEGRRDIEALKGKVQSPRPVAPITDDSIEEIEREVDALERDAAARR